VADLKRGVTSSRRLKAPGDRPSGAVPEAHEFIGFDDREHE